MTICRLVWRFCRATGGMKSGRENESKERREKRGRAGAKKAACVGVLVSCVLMVVVIERMREKSM